MTALDVRERRRRRAGVAARLLASGADAISAIDWDMLDKAPAWLALPEADLATLQRQVGALVYASQMRLWIDGARLGAARVAIGEAFMQALLGQRDLVAFPPDSIALPRIEHASKVPTNLQIVGAAVLLASMPQGSMRRVVTAAMAPTAPAAMAAEMAQSLVSRAQALAAQSSASPLAGVPAHDSTRGSE